MSRSSEQTVRPRLVRIATLDELPAEEPVAFTVESEDIVVVRIDEDVYAIGNLCTHAEGWLDMGELHPETLEIECPLHVGRFDLRSGKPTALPCVKPVKGYRVVVEGTEVMVELPGR